MRAELHQHQENSDARLSDSLDAHNTYLKASLSRATWRDSSASLLLAVPSYSVDKYFQREDFDFPFDNGLYEVRLLTVLPDYRGLACASLLIYAAFRWVQSLGRNANCCHRTPGVAGAVPEGRFAHPASANSVGCRHLQITQCAGERTGGPGRKTLTPAAMAGATVRFGDSTSPFTPARRAITEARSSKPLERSSTTSNAAMT